MFNRLHKKNIKLHYQHARLTTVFHTRLKKKKKKNFFWTRLNMLFKLVIMIDTIYQLRVNFCEPPDPKIKKIKSSRFNSLEFGSKFFYFAIISSNKRHLVKPKFLFSLCISKRTSTFLKHLYHFFFYSLLCTIDFIKNCHEKIFLF